MNYYGKQIDKDSFSFMYATGMYVCTAFEILLAHLPQAGKTLFGRIK